uniref:Uncharacterized protein n=1 Tax=Ananas comosus var. bracteatus TaxID=296719 RepID=A0A6V7PVA0_ANACO|nr:unnamed protein product [Ananas comosus var. bracteatus]
MSTPSSETSHPEVEEEEGNAAQSCTTEALKKRARTFSYSVLLPPLTLFLAIIVQHYLLLNSADKGKPAGEIAVLKTCVVAAVATFSFAGSSLLVAEFLPNDYGPNRYHYLALKFLLHACGFLLKLTAFCLLLLIDAAGNAVMASVVLVATALHVILFNKTRLSTYHSDTAGYAPYAEELDRLMDFSKEMVNFAYGALIGRVFDYFKNFTTDVRHADQKVFDVLMFFTSVIAGLALLLSTLPPLLRAEWDRKRLVGALEWLNIVSALTTMGQRSRSPSGRSEDQHRDVEIGARAGQPGHGASMPVTVAFMCFGVLFAMILNSNGGGNDGDNNSSITAGSVVYLTKVSICLFSVAFIMGLGWRLLEHRLPTAPNFVRAARDVSLCIHTTMVVATVLLVALVCKIIWNFARDGNGAGADARTMSPTSP